MSYKLPEPEFAALLKSRAQLREALRELVNRCDGAEGVRADGSNICTIAAHAALGDFDRWFEYEES